jgi:hypothetical protein
MPSKFPPHHTRARFGYTDGVFAKVGGTEGVGVTFLEETFTASTAPPQHRLHQKAAQAVLKAL